MRLSSNVSTFSYQKNVVTPKKWNIYKINKSMPLEMSQCCRSVDGSARPLENKFHIKYTIFNLVKVFWQYVLSLSFCCCSLYHVRVQCFMHLFICHLCGRKRNGKLSIYVYLFYFGMCHWRPDCLSNIRVFRSTREQRNVLSIFFFPIRPTALSTVEPYCLIFMLFLFATLHESRLSAE